MNRPENFFVVVADCGCVRRGEVVVLVEEHEDSIRVYTGTGYTTLGKNVVRPLKDNEPIHMKLAFPELA